MTRYVLTDAQWAKIEPHCLGKPTDPGRTGGDNRLFLEAVLWIARTGSPWRDLPRGLRQLEHGVQAVPRLGKGRCFQTNIRRLLGRPGYGVRHGRRHDRQGPPPRTGRKRGTQNQAIGKSRGGWTTKILALTDALGNLVRFDPAARPPLRHGGRRAADRGRRLRRPDRRQGLRRPTGSSPNWTSAARKVVISQHPRRDEASRRSTPNSTSGAT